MAILLAPASFILFVKFKPSAGYREASHALRELKVELKGIISIP